MLITLIDGLLFSTMEMFRFSFLYSMLFSKVGVTWDCICSRVKSSLRILFAITYAHVSWISCSSFCSSMTRNAVGELLFLGKLLQLISLGLMSRFVWVDTFSFVGVPVGLLGALLFCCLSLAISSIINWISFSFAFMAPPPSDSSSASYAILSSSESFSSSSSSSGLSSSIFLGASV